MVSPDQHFRIHAWMRLPQHCWSSQDVGGLQEVLRDDPHGAVQLADPPAVDVVVLVKDVDEVSSLEGQLVWLISLAVPQALVVVRII